jgi:hypothetical protein
MHQDIDFGQGDHVTLVGRTRSGKTTGALYSLQRQPKGVLFFNTQQIRFPNVWTRADKETDPEDVIDELIGGGKVVYNPDRGLRQQELTLLIAWLYKMAEEHQSDLDIYVVVDECHLFTGRALKACIELATTGIRWGLKAVWISQRPAKIDNTLMTQSTRFVVFDISDMESQYFKSYRLPFDEIYQKLLEGGQYAYVVHDGRAVSEPKKVRAS